MSQFQDGRAILELISRELSQAVISPNLQFVQDPDLGGTSKRANADCVFWQYPSTSTASGNLAEVGYYLTDNYELKRFYVPPTDSNYQIFTPPNPSDTSAPWVTNVIGSNPSLSTTVSAGVLAFWVRCVDRNGDSIPWSASAPPRFNSAAHFQSAVPNRPNSFLYTSSSTARGNALPSAVELTVITLDSRTFSRNPAAIPPLPAENAPDDLQTVRDQFNQQLIANKVASARTFSTRVNLMNSGQ